MVVHEEEWMNKFGFYPEKCGKPRGATSCMIIMLVDGPVNSFMVMEQMSLYRAAIVDKGSFQPPGSVYSNARDALLLKEGLTQLANHVVM